MNDIVSFALPVISYKYCLKIALSPVTILRDS